MADTLIDNATSVDMDTITNLCKARGFIFQSSEIYGGLGSSYDYGPLGVELKRNVKNAWWRDMIETRDDIVGLDAAIIMAPQVWEASGHLKNFTDPLVDCRECKQRFRADDLDGERRPACGGELTESRQFNYDVQDIPGPRRGRGLGRIPETRDSPGNVRKLRQRSTGYPKKTAVRNRPGRKELPQRDHPGQLHIPDPRDRANGNGVLRDARHR